MNRGMNSTFLVGMLISMAALSLFMWQYKSVVLGENNPEDTTETIKNETLGVAKRIAQGGNTSVLDGEGTCPPSQEELKQAIRNEASDAGIDQAFALAIAEVESDVEHCTNGQVKVNKVSKWSYGVMQVTDSTGKNVCPEADLLDWQDNVACGVQVIQQKQQRLNNNEYENLVSDGCWDEYKEYEGDQLRMTARAYNGFGCGSGADTDYVNKVMTAMEAVE